MRDEGALGSAPRSIIQSGTIQISHQTACSLLSCRRFVVVQAELVPRRGDIVGSDMLEHDRFSDMALHAVADSLEHPSALLLVEDRVIRFVVRIKHMVHSSGFGRRQPFLLGTRPTRLVLDGLVVVSANLDHLVPVEDVGIIILLDMPWDNGLVGIILVDTEVIESRQGNNVDLDGSSSLSTRMMVHGHCTAQEVGLYRRYHQWVSMFVFHCHVLEEGVRHGDKVIESANALLKKSYTEG